MYKHNHFFFKKGKGGGCLVRILFKMMQSLYTKIIVFINNFIFL